MRRNLISNRQLRTFNKFLRDTYSRDHVYINVPKRFGEDLADAWIKEDLKDGDRFIFSYASDKAWFHRCANMPIYCGIKGVSLEEAKDFRDDLMFGIRYLDLDADATGAYPYGVVEDAASCWFKVNVRFPFPQWHEEDQDSDILDEDETNLFGLDGIDEPTIGMTGNWFNEESDQFFRDAENESRQKAAIFRHFFENKPWTISPSSPFSGGTGMKIRFRNENGETEETADFLPLATYSVAGETFLWIWDNPGNFSDYQITDALETANPGLVDDLQKVQSIFESYSFDEFRAHHEELRIEEFESWELLSMAGKKLSADAAYRLEATCENGAEAHTYGLIFYNDKRRTEFTQGFVTLMTKWRTSMKNYLRENPCLCEAASAEFSAKFLNSKNAIQLEKEFKAEVSNEQFLKILRERISDAANEDRRFKGVMTKLIKCLDANE